MNDIRALEIQAMKAHKARAARLQAMKDFGASVKAAAAPALLLIWTWCFTKIGQNEWIVLSASQKEIL